MITSTPAPPSNVTPLVPPEQAADTILLGGKVITVDPTDTIAQGVAIKDGLIQAVGSDDAVRALHDTGLQICVHCVGDAAVDLTLDAFEGAMNANPRPDPRHRIEHCILTTPQATQRIKDLGVVISTQPQFIRLGGDFYPGLLGEERARRIMVTREWLDAGVHVALGSDAPTSPWLTPLATLYGGVHRAIFSKKIYEPTQRLTIQEALRAHTMGGAYAGFEEDTKGSLEPGKLADLAVWKADPYSVFERLATNPTDSDVYLPAFRSLQIDTTMVGGEVVYQA